METIKRGPRRDHDEGAGGEAGSVAVLEQKADRQVVGYHVVAHVDKFDRHQLAAAAKWHGIRYREPNGDELLAWATANHIDVESVEVEGNLLTTAGLTRITSLITGAGGTAYNAANTRIGVGDDATAAAIGNTDLTAIAGSTHRQFALADNSTPTTSAGVITIRATFGTSLANFHWQEWGVDNGTANGTTVTAPLLNHKVTDLGTKTSASSWVFTITITFS